MPPPRRLALPSHVLALLALVAGPAASHPFIDAAGRVVEVPNRAARVVAAGPPASVLLYTLAPDRMAGWVGRPPRPSGPISRRRPGRFPPPAA